MTTTDELTRIAQERARVQSERLHWMLVLSDIDKMLRERHDRERAIRAEREARGELGGCLT